MSRRLLDDKLVNKLAKKLRRKPEAISKMVSAAARRHSLPAPGALVVLAQQSGIGTAIFQRKLDAQTHARIQAVLTPSTHESRPKDRRQNSVRRPSTRRVADEKAAWTSAIRALIQDSMLYERCGDLLQGRSNFDRVINQATQILEHRIRKRLDPQSRLTGEKLVGSAFNEETSRSQLVVSGTDPDHQRGFTQILRGMVPAFRNITHHHVVDTFTREDALSICGFVDFLLRIVDGSEKRTDGSRPAEPASNG